MRDSFVFYKTFYDCIKELPGKSGLALYNAIFEYVFNGTEPELKGLEQGIFAMIKAQIDANNKRYENGKKGAEHGKLGGRPKKDKNPNGVNETEELETPKGINKNPNGVNEETPKGIDEKTPNVNVNENVNVNDINTVSNDTVSACRQLTSKMK